MKLQQVLMPLASYPERLNIHNETLQYLKFSFSDIGPAIYYQENIELDHMADW